MTFCIGEEQVGFRHQLEQEAYISVQEPEHALVQDDTMLPTTFGFLTDTTPVVKSISEIASHLASHVRNPELRSRRKNTGISSVLSLVLKA